MVLGTGPVLTMTVLFLVLLVCLGGAFFMLLERDPGTAATCLFFALASGTAAVFLMIAYFRHRKEDAQREERWAQLEQIPNLEPDNGKAGENENE